MRSSQQSRNDDSSNGSKYSNKNGSSNGNSNTTVYKNGIDTDNEDDMKGLVNKNKRVGSDNHNYNHPPSTISVCVGFMKYQLHSCCFFYPVTCSVVSTLMVCIILWLFFASLFNPTIELGNLHHDHSNIKSKLDLKVSEIDHWCLAGDDDSCTCDNPLIPSPRLDHKSWIVAYKGNRKKVDTYVQMNQNPDVAFVGESIIEEMDGRWLGRTGASEGLRATQSLFQQNFKKEHGAKVEGVALGIAGDTASNVLWRLMHGEMSDEFHPKIWWLSLGMNDLARTKCSEEVVIIGILRIVEEIIEKRPNSHIVINSLFPITTLRGSDYPVLSDVEDSFTDNKATKKNDNNKRKLQEESLFAPNSYSRALQEGKKEKVDSKENDKDSLALEESAEKEEIARDKKAKAHDKKKDSVTLEDKNKVKKFKVGHVRENKLPLWTSVKVINNMLKLFAEKHKEHVSFFDATSIFIEKSDKNKLIIRSDRTTARGHPTLSGFRELEENMLQEIDRILLNMEYADDYIPFEAFAHDGHITTNEMDQTGVDDFVSGLSFDFTASDDDLFREVYLNDDVTLDDVASLFVNEDDDGNF